jgi:hypothetical protein
MANYVPDNYNIVRDYDKVQGTTHPSDLSYQIIRDYNLRYVTIENSSTRPIGIAINTYGTGPVPPILFTLVGGEIKHLGVNDHGGPMQFIWMLDLQTKQPVGSPAPLRSNSNQFVLRDGLNKWFVHYFGRPSYSAAK